jgi:hypothetical protein
VVRIEGQAGSQYGFCCFLVESSADMCYPAHSCHGELTAIFRSAGALSSLNWEQTEPVLRSHVLFSIAL